MLPLIQPEREPKRIQRKRTRGWKMHPLLRSESSLNRLIARWTADRSNGDPPNLSRSIRLDYNPGAIRGHKFVAVGIRQDIRRDFVVIASTESGRNPEEAIRRMIYRYYEKLANKTSV